MKKIGALLFLITSITCFSQTIQNSSNKLHQKIEIEDGKDGKTSISLLFDLDSVYVSEYDSLELDYMYPGIFSQNEKTLNNIFCNDLRKKGSLYEALYKQGFIYSYKLLDTLKYSYKYVCDSVENKINICENCDNYSRQIGVKYYYQKNMGLLVNNNVKIQPIYRYIVPFKENNFLLLDTLNVLWEYNLRSATLNKVNQSFERIINSRAVVDEKSIIRPEFFLTRNSDKKLVIYRISMNSTPIVIDSLMCLIEIEEFDADGTPTLVYQLRDVEQEFDIRHSLVVVKGDTIYNFDKNSNQINYYSTIKSFFVNYYAGAKFEFFNKAILLNKKSYPTYYHQKGLYLLETNPGKYILSNQAFYTVNEISIDSLIQMSPYVIYKSNGKMYIASLSSKYKTINNKKMLQYFIQKLDSAKQLELIDRYDYDGYNSYSSTYHHLYKADGIYKSLYTQKVVKFTPTNFNTAPTATVNLLREDKMEDRLSASSFYIIENENVQYLCDFTQSYAIKDSTNSIIIKEIIERQYQVLDSAKSFEFINPTNIFKVGNVYQSAGIYKADGVIKSADTRIKLPIQNAEMYIKLKTSETSLELFAISHNNQWKILCCNKNNYNQYLILERYSFKTYHDLKKVLYPFELKKVECNTKSESQLFKQRLAELSEKAAQNQAW